MLKKNADFLRKLRQTACAVFQQSHPLYDTAMCGELREELFKLIGQMLNDKRPEEAVVASEFLRVVMASAFPKHHHYYMLQCDHADFVDELWRMYALLEVVIMGHSIHGVNVQVTSLCMGVVSACESLLNQDPQYAVTQSSSPTPQAALPAPPPRKKDGGRPNLTLVKS